jgi:hypothetical protein
MSEPIEVLHVDAHAITLRLPSGQEFGVAFLRPWRARIASLSRTSGDAIPMHRRAV